MLAFDTNLVVYAANSNAPECESARSFLDSLRNRRDVALCELVLVEVYLKIRSPKVLTDPYGAAEAAGFCQRFRRNKNWLLVENAPVMDEVWQSASQHDFAIRRIIDARLALTLRHYGVTEFATANAKDFEGFGFSRVWNPLES